jgi:hypothetical protein
MKSQLKGRQSDYSCIIYLVYCTTEGQIGALTVTILVYFNHMADMKWKTVDANVVMFPNIFSP